MRTILSLALLSANAILAHADPVANPTGFDNSPMIVARAGADDPAGHVRGGRGADNAPTDVRRGRGTDNTTTTRGTRSPAQAAGTRGAPLTDDPAGDVRRGRGKDDPIGHV